MIYNDIQIDIDKLRNDLIDYLGSPLFRGFTVANLELAEVKVANRDTLIKIAKKNGFDLSEYRKNKTLSLNI